VLDLRCSMFPQADLLHAVTVKVLIKLVLNVRKRNCLADMRDTL